MAEARKSRGAIIRRGERAQVAGVQIARQGLRTRFGIGKRDVAFRAYEIGCVARKPNALKRGSPLECVQCQTATFAFVYIGSIAREAATASRARLIVYIVGGIAALAVSIYVGRMATVILSRKDGEGPVA